MPDFALPIDPLRSPHPIPWSWVLAIQEEYCDPAKISSRYYRTSSLISPNQEYAAYSRLQLQIAPNPLANRVNSVLFIEHLSTGTLQTPIATSPLSHHPLYATPEADEDGVFGFLIPISWSGEQDGELRLLARQFEGIFGSSYASDYALVWEPHHGKGVTIAPTNCDYTYSVLLGWSQSQPGSVLFQTGLLGKKESQNWAVDLAGNTLLVEAETPLIFGEVVNSIWTGPQSHYDS